VRAASSVRQRARAASSLDDDPRFIVAISLNIALRLELSPSVLGQLRKPVFGDPLLTDETEMGLPSPEEHSSKHGEECRRGSNDGKRNPHMKSIRCGDPCPFNFCL
jgi:hypothetical protein